MNGFDIFIAILMVIYLVWWDRSPLDRLVSALVLASFCISHDQPALRAWLVVIAFVVLVARTVLRYRKPSEDEPVTPPGPRMSAHELMSLYEDIAKADRLLATGQRVDQARASELMKVAIDQAAAPRQGL